MDKFLSSVLRYHFPNLYPDYFGFECGGGWFDLLWDLSRDLSRLQRKEPLSVGTIDQVKEKFGTLRFYISGSREAYNIINTYEEKSGTICENCGGLGQVIRNKRDWYRVLCEKCRQEWERR